MNKFISIYILSLLVNFNINCVVSNKNFCQEDGIKNLHLSNIDNISNTKIITLRTDNLVNIRGPILDKSVDVFVNKLLKIASDEIFIFINSPGGVVTEGLRFIQIMQSFENINKKVYCIVDKGASMAFVIFQHCQNRYIIDGSILMQHQMSGGMSGPIENVRNRMKLFNNIYLKMNNYQSNRLKLTLNEFLEKVTSDWWLFDNEILTENAGDEKVKIICHPDLLKNKEIIEHKSLFGLIKFTFNRCPLINTPSKIELKEFESDTYRIVNDEKTLSIIKTDFLEFNKEKGYYNEI